MMKFPYTEESLKGKGWVKALAVINTDTMEPVYAWGPYKGLATGHAQHMAEPGLDNKKGAWTTGAFYTGDGLQFAFLREIGDFAFIVEGDSPEAGYAAKKREAKSLARAARRDLKIQGLLYGLGIC
ncbi:MAG: hypothetical protein HYS53_02235 [Candidatus Aenigmarchaeota archaeon]|nr:hypothetical protein [Candidatus Aenigmarchaeota archaeon]